MSWVADDRALDRLAGVLRETELAEGARVGDRYRIVRFIGRGGMGEVYLAADEMLHREVALKTLRRFRPGAKAVDLILAEARTVARLQHPGIVPIYDLGILPDGRLFYTMMYVAGRPLLEAMRRSADPAVLFLALCRAVAHAHEAGFVHGDLKPANVLVAADGGVMVLDWGLARPLASEDQAPGAGTPAYMAPELASATPQARDPRIDVFALGTILRQAVEDRPAADFDPVLRRALATSPDGRYRDAGELAGDVARVLQRRRARRQRGRLAVAAGVLALVGAAAAMFAMLKEDRRERARVHFDRGQALLRASERAS
ncbi:MAG: serine/threonine protein kinase, partial [Planctomycetes bacterium]|nr:serine/threonine protein kinase [Planctomycetota bacterium]